MVDLTGRPFHLREKDVQWVQDTLAGMTLEEKVGQIFCPIGTNGEEGYLRHLLADLKVGAMMFRMAPKDELYAINKRIQEIAKIPLLLAANLESGGNGAVVEGTSFGKPMSVAATGNEENAYRMGKVSCREGAAVGVNWAFAPIVDIDREFHSPITNVRTFGSDQETIIKCALGYMKAADEEKVAVSIKHFPGDGTDERDQHLLTSVNCLPADEWRDTYGKIYQTLIEHGAKTVMAGHIAQPALVKELNPNASRSETLLPATLSKELLTGVLRDELKFNGLVVTDSSQMVGFSCAMPRKQAIPTALANGCDMILFNRNLEEDYQYVLWGLQEGILTETRLDEAVTRILATKASLSLHEKKAADTLVPDPSAKDIIGCEEFRKWAAQCADESVTLVRDTQNLLPLSPQKTKRVYLNVIQHDLNPNHEVVQEMKRLFEKEGFEVSVRNRETRIGVENLFGMNLTPEKEKMVEEINRGVEEFKESHDLYVYVANVETSSNNTVIRLNWNVLFGMGDDAPWFTEEVPTLFISTQNPYHLFDAPMMKTYINTYDNNVFSRAALMDKLMGRSPFKGQSPVDPYCGNPYI